MNDKASATAVWTLLSWIVLRLKPEESILSNKEPMASEASNFKSLNPVLFKPYMAHAMAVINACCWNKSEVTKSPSCGELSNVGKKIGKL